MSRSIAARNAASVLPDPVGAKTSGFSPFAIAGQASSCARVGDSKVVSNQARVAALKLASGSLPTRNMLGVDKRKGPPRMAGLFSLCWRLRELVDLNVPAF